MNDVVGRIPGRRARTRWVLAAMVALAGLVAVVLPASPASAEPASTTSTTLESTTTSPEPSSTTEPSTPSTAPSSDAVSHVAAVGPAPIPGDLWDIDPAVGPNQSYVAIDGTPGDGMSGGRDFLYTKANASLGAGESDLLRVYAQGDEEWSGTLGPLEYFTPVQVGLYEVNALPAPSTGQMRWTAIGPYGSGLSGCNGQTGWFAVDEITGSGSTIQSLTLRFSLRCDDGPALHGKVRWNASDTTSPPGLQPVPTGLWDVDLGIGGDYVYVEGANGDALTNGNDYLYTEPFATLEVTGTGNYATASADGAQTWVGSFQGVASLDELQPGYFGDLKGGPVGNPVKGHMSWVRRGANCLNYSGWFAIDELVRSGGAITKLVLRLEQSCDGAQPLHAKVVIGSDAPPRPPGSPTGYVDEVVAVPGGIGVVGWALDPDVAGPIRVRIDVGDDYETIDILADIPRDDIAAAFPGYGSAHGFGALIGIEPGVRQVCVTALDVGVGNDTPIGCRTVNVLPAGSPFGTVDTVTTGLGTVNVSGWAIDPDTWEPIDVHVYVDGQGFPTTAGNGRPDVGGAFPGYGPAHGFSSSIPAAPGSHQVCAWAINRGTGGNTLLGCRTVNVPGGSPIGTIDVARGSLGAVTVAGWALDPDTAAPISVHVYVDGAGSVLNADGGRGDIAAAFPGYGAAHGFGTTVAAAPGNHQVCVWAINAGAGGNSLLGCRTVTVPNGPPIGVVDVASGGAGVVNVAGWALDPDTAAPVAAHVYVDSAGSVLNADGGRGDIAAAFPGYGAAHGFGATVAAAPGAHQVCVWAINTGIGSNSLLGCRSVTVS